MRQYQELYIKNTKRVNELLDNHIAPEVPPERFYEQKVKDHLEIERCREESMAILREKLIPLLDDILNAVPEDISSLEEFADVLTKEQLDNGLQYQVSNALVVYARTKGNRELLIKELYLTAMAAYNFQKMEGGSVSDRFRWKMHMLFGEAAGFIRYYDEIADVDTRGYIHRAMGNLALGYVGNDTNTVVKKMNVIRRSLQVLTDPVYRQKTPDLPWELYVYKTHQERTTLLSYLRSGDATLQDIREVMESAQYVYDRQLKSAKEKGVSLQPQWSYAYYAASYHGGIHTLEEFLQNMEKIYTSVSIADYSQQGLYGNVYIPALYSFYMKTDEQICEKKKPVILTMYRRLVQYVKQFPESRFKDALFFYIRGSLDTYIEFAGEYSFKEFIEDMVACRQPETYVHSLMVAKISQAMLHRVMKEEPERLLGVRGCDSVEALLAKEDELANFIYECGILHDIGKMKLLSVYAVQNRGWIAEEEELHHMHTVQGYQILRRWPSTRDYAIAALGHHRHYDGQGGYPEDYNREETADAVLVDILSVADYIDRNNDIIANYQGKVFSLDEIYESLKEGSGTVLAPCFVRVALDIWQEISDILAEERPEAYKRAYEIYL